MSNKHKYIDIKNYMYYSFNDIVNMRIFDANNIKTNEKSNRNIAIYYIYIYVMIKDLKYVKINSANLLYLIFSKVKRYFEESNKNKYLKLVPRSNKKYKEVWSKIRDLIR